MGRAGAPVTEAQVLDQVLVQWVAHVPIAAVFVTRRQAKENRELNGALQQLTTPSLVRAKENLLRYRPSPTNQQQEAARVRDLLALLTEIRGSAVVVKSAWKWVYLNTTYRDVINHGNELVAAVNHARGEMGLGVSDPGVRDSLRDALSERIWVEKKLARVRWPTQVRLFRPPGS